MKAARPNTSTAVLPGILLETSPTDHRRHGARYEQIAKRLRGDGWDARITINHSERRSAVTEVVVRLLDQTGCSAVDALIPLLATHVRRSCCADKVIASRRDLPPHRRGVTNRRDPGVDPGGSSRRGELMAQ